MDSAPEIGDLMSHELGGDSGDKGLGRRATIVIASATLLGATRLLGFSAGSPVCEVNTLPVLEMATALASPPPAGWALSAEEEAYRPGTPLVLRVTNVDPERLARGVLLWARLGPTAGAGRFELPPGGLFQYVPASADCGEWAVTHTDASPKAQSELVFSWRAPEDGAVILRAFVVEDCGQADCRAHQALTPVLSLAPRDGLFADGFETARR